MRTTTGPDRISAATRVEIGRSATTGRTTARCYASTIRHAESPWKRRGRTSERMLSGEHRSRLPGPLQPAGDDNDDDDDNEEEEGDDDDHAAASLVIGKSEAARSDDIDRERNDHARRAEGSNVPVRGIARNSGLSAVRSCLLPAPTDGHMHPASLLGIGTFDVRRTAYGAAESPVPAGERPAPAWDGSVREGAPARRAARRCWKRALRCRARRACHRTLRPRAGGARLRGRTTPDPADRLVRTVVHPGYGTRVRRNCLMSCSSAGHDEWTMPRYVRKSTGRLYD